MGDEILRIVIEELGRICLEDPDVDGVDRGTRLGADGLGMDSLSIAELTVSLETALGADLAEMELDDVKGMTVEQFTEHIRCFVSTGGAT